MGKQQRYSVQWTDGTIRTVVAQSYRGARNAFIDEYDPPANHTIKIWSQEFPNTKKHFRT